VNILKCPSTKILSSLELNKNKNDLEFHLPLNTIKENLSSSIVDHLEKIQDESVKIVKLDFGSKKPKFIFQLNKNWIVQEVFGDPLTKISQNNPQNLVFEFSSPNIAKPFHVGHLRSTIIGNFLSNLFHHTGNKITRLNYLGDWGTQFGFLKVGIDLENLTDEEIQRNPIQCLFKAYVTANTLAQKDPSISEKARQVFQQLESDSFEDMQRWESIRKYTIDELKRIYQRLNVEFDEYNWESMYNKKKIQEIVDMLDAQNILIDQEDGKRVAQVGDRRIPIVKSDGTTLYLTRDIAAIIDRKQRFKFDKIYYIVDNGQNDHFQALKSLVHQLKFDWSSQMEHVKFGRIRGMSTRKGTVVFLQDILDEAKEIMWRRQNESSSKSLDTVIN
jgi:arginyl-tRNA synthetase